MAGERGRGDGEGMSEEEEELTDYIVVTQEMPSLSVDVARAVDFVTELATAGDASDKGPELGAVEPLLEQHEVGEERR